MSQMNNTPDAERIHIVLVGLRNAGKSSLINQIFEREVAIVSDTPGTTTDPVTRRMELDKLGPVAVTDTAGLDDVGELGGLRIERTKQKLAEAHISLLVSNSTLKVESLERQLADQLSAEKKGFILVLTHADQHAEPTKLQWAAKYNHILVDNQSGKGILALRKKLILLKDDVEIEISPLEGLVTENDLVLLVTPIDLAAPKGRLILPQVETIRDALDKDCSALIVKERELYNLYNSVGIKPKLVICDSQAFSKVAADIPDNQLLTSFSILFARKKGDLATFVKGVSKLNQMQGGGKVLILESCSHHRQADDIGTVKIPRLFNQLISADTKFEFSRDLPDDSVLTQYNMVINCAACTVNRNHVMHRIDRLNSLEIPVVNYGLFLAWVNGLLPRALEPFPYEFELYNSINQ